MSILRKKQIIISLGLIFMCCVFLVSHNAQAFFGKSFTKISASALNSGEFVEFPAKEFSEKVTFYRIPVDGKNVDFLIVRTKDGKFRAALDACDSCWREKKGYTQNDDEVICQNCGMKFRLERIAERKGGCNPHPLAVTLKGDPAADGIVQIRGAELIEAARFF